MNGIQFQLLWLVLGLWLVFVVCSALQTGRIKDRLWFGVQERAISPFRFWYAVMTYGVGALTAFALLVASFLGVVSV